MWIKRLMDVIGAGAGLALTWPVILLVALAIRLTQRGPVFFRQARPGLHGRLFTVVKFRTMREAFGSDGEPLPDGQRLTALGRFLRRTSLDELPQLWNVLTGDMSLVGPRPLLPEYLPLYNSQQMRRHEVRPGITGWAQVNGRNAAGWEDRFHLDVWYVDHWSLALDCRILWMTVARVFRGEGVTQAGHATVERFRGSR